MEISDSQGPGAASIKLYTSPGRSIKASAGFQFEVTDNLLNLRTLFQHINVLTGDSHALPSSIRGDLTRYEFVEVGPDHLFVGCRDWI